MTDNARWEETVIGTVLMEPNTWVEADRIQPKDFLGSDHQKIWSVIIDLARTNSVSTIALTEQLRSEGILSEIGTEDSKGEKYLYNLISYGDPVGIRIFVSEVLNLSLKRSLGTIAAAMNHDAYNGKRADEIIDDYVAQLSMLRKTKRSKAVSIAELVNNTLERLEKLKLGEMAYPWYPRLDAVRKVIGGCDQGDFVLIPSFPGGGKSSYARYEALKTAMDGQGVLFLNLENPPEFFSIEGAALLSGIENTVIRNPRGWTKDQEERIREAFQQLKTLPLYTPQKTGLISVQDAISIVRFEITQHQIDFIVVDHLQILGNSENKSDFERVMNSAQQLRGLAQETGIPILCTAQTNRGNQDRNAASENTVVVGRRPKLSDIQYAGEQPAKKILAPYLLDIPIEDGTKNPENRVGNIPQPRKNWRVEFMRFAIIKNTSGRTGDTEDVEWFKGTGDFKTLAPDWRGNTQTQAGTNPGYNQQGFNPIPRQSGFSSGFNPIPKPTKEDRR